MSYKSFLLCLISIFPLSGFTELLQSSFWEVNSNYPVQSIDKALAFAQQMEIEDRELAERLSTGLKAAQLAGAKIREIVVQNQGEIKFIAKADGSPVTEADYASSLIIQEIINQSHPKDLFISEENDEKFKPDARYSWVVDPIDGTKNFINKGTDWGIHIAVIFNQRPVVGINYYPGLDKVYFGAWALGSYLQTADSFRQLTPSKAATPLAIASTNYNEIEKAIINALKQAKIVGTEKVEIRSVGLRLMSIAEGNPLLFFQEPKRSYQRSGVYDFASSDLILQEAGVSMTDCFGNLLDYSDRVFYTGVLATPSEMITSQVLPFMQEILKN